jgi:DNA modification methylase
MNRLFYGDNLDILRRYLASESVDLIYLDPPFKSEQNYNVLFAERDGTLSASQMRAFEDTWEWNPEVERDYNALVASSGRVADMLRALRTLLGRSDMLAYLVMMAPRVIELHRVLKPTGSVYLHCDATASAYLRLLMDAVFRPENFRNEISWHYYNKMHDRRKRLFPRATDTLLFYVKDMTQAFTFRQLTEKRDKPVKQLLRKKVGGRMVNAKDADGHVMYQMREDRIVDNVWRIPCLQPAAQERLGYPTQKPEALLARIIEASSNEGDLVLDPFCGCGTTIAVAHRLRRHWIGIDVTQAAMVVIKGRFRDHFGIEIPCEITGEPVSLPDAEALAKSDPYQFQWWALGLVHARPAEQRKGADKGIDGRRYFTDPLTDKTEQIVFSVKAGHLSPTHIRDLRGVVERERAVQGVLLCLEEPSKSMRVEAAAAGTVKTAWGEHPKLQIITIKELLSGDQLKAPPARQLDVTYRRAPRAVAKVAEQRGLYDVEPQMVKAKLTVKKHRRRKSS